MTSTRWVFVAAWFAFVAAGLPSLAAEPVLVDRVVAIVDEEAILLSDLNRAVDLYQLDRQYQELPEEPVTPELREETLQSLIESKLVIAAAKQADLTVEEDEITRRVDERIDELVKQYGSREALAREMTRSGLTTDDFRDRYGNQLREQQYLRLVIGRFIRPKVEVLSNEVEEYYLGHLDEMPAQPDSVTLADILIRVQPAADARLEAQRKITLAQDALRAGEDFADVAGRFDESPNAQRGGQLGVVRTGDLFDKTLEAAVFGLAAGAVSQPVVSSRGVHIVRIDAVQDDGARAISQIFIPLQATDADAADARTRADAARARVVAGETFSLVASETSDDPQSAKNGGLLGTFQLDALSPQFQAVLKDAPVGQPTEPLLTPTGWYVFQVLDRVEGHKFTYEELKEDLRRHVENQKIETELKIYINDLRERFFVDLKE
jgi:peptidyl-prolyl cis-trans isomerase SurA